MKYKIILALAILVTMFSSCDKEEISLTLDESVITYKNTGTLAVSVLHSDSSAYVGEKIRLYNDNDILVDEVYTDEQGLADFSELLEGTYSIYGEGFEEGVFEYSIERNLQIVTNGEKKLTIIPKENSGKLTISLNVGQEDAYGNVVGITSVNKGTVALVNRTSIGSIITLEDVKNKILVQKELSEESSELTFDSIPTGSYMLMYYTDPSSLQVLFRVYSIEGSEYYDYSYTSIYKDADINKTYLINEEISDYYKGSLELSIYEYLQVGYNSYTEPSALVNAKVALLDGYAYSYSSFEELKDIMYAEKELDGSSNTVLFEDVPTGDYYVMVYTDEDHFQLGRLNYTSSSYSKLNVYRNKTTTHDVLVNGGLVREILLDQQFYVYKYDSSTNYQQEGVVNATVYIVSSNTYSNLSYDFKKVEFVIEKSAIKSGVTDANGKITLSCDAYTDLVAVAFDEEGNYIDYSSFEVIDGSGVVNLN